MTKYKFMGYTIYNCGYHQPDHCVWWEAVDENGEACFHGHTLREVEFEILDYEWEQKMRRKDEEIEKLKASTVGNTTALRKALKATIEKLLDCAPTAEQEFPELVQRVHAAALAPARNCDVGTPEEQARRFDAFCCARHFQSEKCCSDCPCHGADKCEFKWGQLSYEEKGESNEQH